VKLAMGMKFRNCQSGRLAYMITSPISGDGQTSYQLLNDDGKPIGARYRVNIRDIEQDLAEDVVVLATDEDDQP
jgi:hypothetical protein